MSGGLAPKIKIAGLYLDLGTRTVLRNIELTIPAGAKSVVIGPSASGKTVLLKCCAGILKPTAGTVEIDGTTSSEANRSDIAHKRWICISAGRTL